MPTVSVIIPAYNCERFIGEAVQSVLDQTYDDLEITLVDDGSTDGTRNIIENKYRNKVRYIYQPNKGAPAARNLGFKVSSK